MDIILNGFSMDSSLKHYFCKSSTKVVRVVLIKLKQKLHLNSNLCLRFYRNSLFVQLLKKFMVLCYRMLLWRFSRCCNFEYIKDSCVYVLSIYSISNKFTSSNLQNIYNAQQNAYKSISLGVAAEVIKI